MDRQQKMDYLFHWFLVEVRGNIAVGFTAATLSTFLFGRRRFLTLQAIFLGAAVGTAVNNASFNFRHLDGPGMARGRMPSYTEYFYQVIGYR